jgi:signal transduction histidine kinase
VVTLADAVMAAVLVPRDPADREGRLRVAAVSGDGWDGIRGLELELADTLAGSAFVSGRAAHAERLETPAGPLAALGPTMALPLVAQDKSLGVLVVGRALGRRPFGAAELQMAADFAAHASLALTFAEARETRQRMELVRDRGRIARELHDNVIQQLFGSGLELQGLLGTGLPEPVNETVARVTEQLDDAISQIRLAIFAMTATSSAARSLRHRIIDAVEQFRAELLRSPRFEFRGALDSAVPRDLADDVVAVVRESVANVAKHARALNVRVSVALADRRLRVEVADDGRGGVQHSTRRSGLANLEERARARGGTMTVSSGAAGTTIGWEAPVPD